MNLSLDKHNSCAELCECVIIKLQLIYLHMQETRHAEVYFKLKEMNGNCDLDQAAFVSGYDIVLQIYTSVRKYGRIALLILVTITIILFSPKRSLITTFLTPSLTFALYISCKKEEK